MKKINRRNFLKSSFLTAASLSIPVRSWSQVVGASDTIRVATVGFNGRGKDHIGGILKLQEKKVIIGTERVLKALKDKKLHRVFMAKNCPSTTKKDLQYYAKLAEIPVIELDMTNEEMGIFCKKNYFVAVVGTIEE